jgi:hypothetical protein
MKGTSCWNVQSIKFLVSTDGIAIDIPPAAMIATQLKNSSGGSSKNSNYKIKSIIQSLM